MRNAASAIALWLVAVGNLSLVAAGVAFQGRVVNEVGAPVEGVQAVFRDVVRVTDARGLFVYDNLLRVNGLLYLSKTGYYTEVIPVQLATDEDAVVLQSVQLQPHHAAVERMLFGGDVMFGRRYFNPSLEPIPLNVMPPYEEGSMLKVATVYNDTVKLLKHLVPILRGDVADLHHCNLETAAIGSTATLQSGGHPDKDFVYFSMPGSVKALAEAGIEYVTLGNNHVFDYLQAGMAETLANVEPLLAHSGAGLTEAEAFKHKNLTFRGRTYSFVSACSIAGKKYQPEYWYVASSGLDDVVEKGGAADLTKSDKVVSAIEKAYAGGATFPIVHAHTGLEYALTISGYARNRINVIAESINGGVSLIVGHHSHVAEGFGIVNGIPVVHSLGNLVFDSNRHETLLGLIVVVTFRDGLPQSIKAVPVLILDFVPTLLGGEMANRFIRRMAHHSDHGTLLFPWAGKGFLSYNLAKDKVRSVSRQLDVTVALDEAGRAIVDLRDMLDSAESLAHVQVMSDSGGEELRLTLGRDIMVYGTMEDCNADDSIDGTTEWFHSASSFRCTDKVHRGYAAMCSQRSSTSTSASILKFRKRVRVIGDPEHKPIKNVSLYGYMMGERAGPITATVQFAASDQAKTFGQQMFFLFPGGDFAWSPLMHDVDFPPDLCDPPSNDEICTAANGTITYTQKWDFARSLGLVIRHYPPGTSAETILADTNDANASDLELGNYTLSAGTDANHSSGTATDALMVMDDMAWISWEEDLDPRTGSSSSLPHVYDFLRVSTYFPGVLAAAGRTVQLRLTAVNYVFDRPAPPAPPGLSAETQALRSQFARLNINKPELLPDCPGQARNATDYFGWVRRAGRQLFSRSLDITPCQYPATVQAVLDGDIWSADADTVITKHLFKQPYPTFNGKTVSTFYIFYDLMQSAPGLSSGNKTLAGQALGVVTSGQLRFEVRVGGAYSLEYQVSTLSATSIHQVGFDPAVHWHYVLFNNLTTFAGGVPPLRPATLELVAPLTGAQHGVLVYRCDSRAVWLNAITFQALNSSGSVLSSALLDYNFRVGFFDDDKDPLNVNAVQTSRMHVRAVDAVVFVTDPSTSLPVYEVHIILPAALHAGAVSFRVSVEDIWGGSVVKEWASGTSQGSFCALWSASAPAAPSIVDYFSLLRNHTIWPTNRSSSSAVGLGGEGFGGFNGATMRKHFGPSWKPWDSDSLEFNDILEIACAPNSPVVATLPGLVQSVDREAGTLYLRVSFCDPKPAFHDKKPSYYHVRYMGLRFLVVEENEAVVAGQLLGYSEAMLGIELRVWTRCTLAYALANPGVTCANAGTNIDPNVNPYFAMPALPPDTDLGAASCTPIMELVSTPQTPLTDHHYLSVMKLSTLFLVRYSLPWSCAPLLNKVTLLQETNLSVSSNDTQLVWVPKHQLDLNMRYGYDATTTKALNTPDTSKVWLVPQPNVFPQTTWYIELAIPMSFANFSMQNNYRLDAQDIWGASISLLSQEAVLVTTPPQRPRLRPPPPHRHLQPPPPALNRQLSVPPPALSPR